MSKPAVDPSGASPAGAEAELFEFGRSMGSCFVANRVHNSPIRMCGVWNASASTDATDGDPDFELEAGDWVTSPNIQGFRIKSVAIWFSGACTWKTDFIIKGHAGG